MSKQRVINGFTIVSLLIQLALMISMQEHLVATMPKIITIITGNIINTIGGTGGILAPASIFLLLMAVLAWAFTVIAHEISGRPEPTINRWSSSVALLSPYVIAISWSALLTFFGLQSWGTILATISTIVLVACVLIKSLHHPTATQNG